MGFSSISSHVLWFLATVAIFGTVTDAWFDHQATVDDARAERFAIDGERLLTRFSAATFCHDPVRAEVVVEADHVGEVPLRLDRLAFVVDGAPALTYAGAIVGGASGTSLWLHGERALFTVSGVTAEPDSLVLVTERGARVYPEKIACPRLTTIVVTPASANLAIGESATFVAQGFDQFGQPFDGAPYAWTSDAGAVTTLDATSARLTAGTTAGSSFFMRASSAGVDGDADVTVRPGAPASVAVSPDPANVPAGSTQAFTADVRDAHGNVNSTAPVAWTTTAGSISAGGVLTAQTLAQGGREVRATVGALQDAATVHVVPGPAARVTVTPGTATVRTLETQPFTAAAYDQYDNVISGATFAWGATRGGVTPSGIYTAPATVGADTVTATHDGVQGSSAVTVTSDIHVASLATYKEGVPATEFRRGTDTVDVRAEVRDHNGDVVEGATVTVELRRQNGQLQATLNGATAANGVASLTYALPGNANKSDWTATVTSVSKTGHAYDAASNVVTQVTFTVK